jgi:bacterioferritin-associated ferredoxin
VCLCKNITCSQIRSAACQGACTVRDLKDQLGLASQCGKCAQYARGILEETLQGVPGQPEPQIA